MVIFLMACAGSDDADTGDTDTDTQDDTGVEPDPENVELGGECNDSDHWGNFTVDSNEDYAYVTGVLANGVVPVSVLTDMLASGDCHVWKRENPFCDPSCDPGYTCDLDGTCVEYPANQDIGTVEVFGLSQAVAMEPLSPGNTYFDTSIPNPPWIPGDLLTLRTGGGAYEVATAYGVAPVALVPTTLDWTVVTGQPLTLTWDAPTTPARTEVVFHMRIDLHGITPSSIECVYEDDGSADVPAEVLDALMALGVSGFPESDIARRTADTTSIGGACLDFLATSSHLGHITIEGYTPCTRDEDCPEGESCNVPMERCE